MDTETVLSRRGLVAGALGAGVLALGAQAFFVPAFAQAADGPSEDAAAASGDQYGFLVRVDRCTDCEECVRACRRANETPEAMPSRRKVKRYEVEPGYSAYVSTSCMHCAEPACAEVCPAGAIVKGDGGVVTVNSDRCIGCKYCYQACPFEVPHYGAQGMDKCDCCLGAGVPLGDTPNCAKACKFRALSYGTLASFAEETGGAAKRVECSTEPSLMLY